ncbi:MAG: hypothetical protein JO122_13340 [Acetobacteraceae bacterium]|nr:hypothetical protein [Acetobacteraceae bacterium]
MSTTVHEAPNARTTRLSVLVSAPEAAEIARRAEAAGLSVSAFLREQALGLANRREDAEALRRVDDLIDRMTRDVDEAIEQVTATLARLDRR